MPTAYAFHLVNVFTVDGDRFSGNPLCVLPDASGLSDAQLLAIARQMNLSETTFVLPAPDAAATATVRIFTPGFEMPFAGHPTLGTAAVLGAARDLAHVTLALPAGRVPVTRGAADTWTLRAAQAPVTRAPAASREELASMVSLPAAAIAGPPLWVNTGVEQLVIPLASAADVRAARPAPAAITRHGLGATGEEAMAYVWAREGDDVLARFFFTQHGAVVEDPATGSACANLGGWWLATGGALPHATTVWQGAAVHRPSRLGLRVTAARDIEVTGQVVALGTGTLWV